jgi:DNA polymerase-3 subunit epsilon
MNSTDRHEAIKLAQDLLAAQPVYLDTETTGLGDADQIVEICILDHEGQPLVNTLVKPRQQIPPDATAIHRITNAMVAAAPLWSDVWPTVVAALADRTVAIYNADYDLRLMKQTNRIYRLPWPLIAARFECVMLLYARYRGEWDSYRRSYRWQSLDAAGRQCRIDLPNKHRAYEDASLARAILQHMADGVK